MVRYKFSYLEQFGLYRRCSGLNPFTHPWMSILSNRIVVFARGKEGFRRIYSALVEDGMDGYGQEVDEGSSKVCEGRHAGLSNSHLLEDENISTND